MKILASIFASLAIMAFALPASADGLIFPGLDVSAGIGLGAGLDASGTLTAAGTIGDSGGEGSSMGLSEANAFASNDLTLSTSGMSGGLELSSDSRSYSGAMTQGDGWAYNVSGSVGLAGTAGIGGGVIAGF